MAEPGLFLFDIDGTLIRGGTAVHRDAFAYAFRQVYDLDLSLDGIPAGGRTDTWLFMEPLRRYGLDEAEIRQRMPQAFALMEAYVEEHLLDIRDRVLPGVPEVLQRLADAGQVIGLLTGNLRGIAFAKMRHAGLARFFRTGGFGEESAIRTHLVPVALRETEEHFGLHIPPERTVLVGDTPLDVEAGKLAGTRTAAVASGLVSLTDLQATEADLVLPSLEPPAMAADSLLRLITERR